MLTRDVVNGEQNKAVLNGWLAKWVPQSINAARQLQPIWSQPHEKVVTFDESFALSTASFAAVLDDLDLEIPQELKK
jgi:propane monooxygenase small subunit